MVDTSREFEVEERMGGLDFDQGNETAQFLRVFGASPESIIRRDLCEACIPSR